MTRARAIVVACLASALCPGPALAAEETEEMPAPWSQAEDRYGSDVMRSASNRLLHHHGGQVFWFVMADRFETQFREGDEALVWDGQGFVGTDRNKLFVKTEGDYGIDGNDVEDAEVQALWSRAVSTFFDLQAGLRYDFEPESTVHGVLGVQGLAPYRFELDLAAFISDEGDLTFRAEVEYELLLTQRLILQPRIEANFAAQDISNRRVGRGVSDLDIGLRLRFEILREFAPYVGLEWQSAFGNTADFIEEEGGDPDGLALLAGVRVWF